MMASPNPRIIIRKHVFLRARQRGIYPDMIYATIKGGRQRKFGRNEIKFLHRYKRGFVVCVGEIKGGTIIIKTVEWK